MPMMQKEVSKSRIVDFIMFHNESCLADSIVKPMLEYLKLRGIDDKETKRKAVAFYSLTYSVPTTIIMLEKYQEFVENPEIFWKKYKDKLLFQSDRKYVKMNDRFVQGFMSIFERKIFDKLDNFEILDIEKCVNLLETVYSFGRFSAFLFLETYGVLFNRRFVNARLDWDNGSTVTSGMFNVLGDDKSAEEWDKYHNLVINIEYFDSLAKTLVENVSIGKDLTILETNLCAYRKLFKGSRYIGYYSDRVLEELYTIINRFPEHKKELDVLFLARELSIPDKYLGEKHGWTGIRKEMKKYYLEKGVWQW